MISAFGVNHGDVSKGHDKKVKALTETLDAVTDVAQRKYKQRQKVTKGLPSAMKRGKLLPMGAYGKSRLSAHRYGKESSKFVRAARETNDPNYYFGAFATNREGVLARAASRRALK